MTPAHGRTPGQRPWAGCRVVQAALSGYSDEAMRVVARAHGAGFCMHEVELDEHVLQRGRLRQRILRVAADDHPLGGQLMGSQPDTFAAAATDLVAAGYDQVDVNFGCPVSKCAGRQRGGYLLGEPDVAIAILREVVGAVGGRVPVTVKMRRGIDDSAAAERRFFTILDAGLAAGIAGVTVHGRTVRQKYVGPSSWEFLRRVKEHVGDRGQVYGSGDLFTAADAARMFDRTGVDGVTLARGCIGNPWLFGQVAAVLDGLEPGDPSVAEQRAALELHLDRAIAVYGSEARAGRRVRTHAIKYAARHPWPVAVRDAFVAARTVADVRRALARWYPRA